jgi:D-alanyl-D-alanine carboxypeptidase
VQQARRLFVIVCLLAACLAPSTTFAAARHHHHRPAATTTKQAAPAGPPIVVPTPELLVDMQTGNVLYEDNAGLPWHPASLTKLMTAYVAFEAIAQGRATLDTRVTMSVKAVNQAPSRSGLPAGDSVTLKDALYIMLVKSANDMAVAIAETLAGSTEAYAAEMNATAVTLGLTRTHYDNVNGLPDDGQVTTARDLAVLAIDLRRTFPQYDEIYTTQSVHIGKVSLKASNGLLSKLAGTTGMKTGYICASGLNIVATVKRDGRELLAVVLGRTSARERDQTAAQLLLGGFSGQYPDRGKSVVNIVDEGAAAPIDMKPLLCGAKAKTYVAQQRQQHPFGLKGQPNYLTDKVAAVPYLATDLGPVGGSGPVVSNIRPEGQTAEGDAGSDDDAPAPDAEANAAAAPAVHPLPPPTRRK